MIHIKELKDGLALYEALSSPVRLDILELLAKKRKMNLNDIANSLNLTNGAITKHIKKLNDGGLINITLVPSNRGTQKICTIADEKILIDIKFQSLELKRHEIEFDVGQFSDYKINPTCGFATTEKLTCELDNIKCFSLPERFYSNIVWFSDGYVTYRFPNPCNLKEKIREIQFSFEIGGEAPGVVEDYPTLCCFSLNNIILAEYILPGEYSDRRGRLTPDWWYSNFANYGRLHIIIINEEGVFLDGLQTSEKTLNDFIETKSTEFHFSIMAKVTKDYIGGVTLFGKGFGDYNQGIKLCVLVE